MKQNEIRYQSNFQLLIPFSFILDKPKQFKLANNLVLWLFLFFLIGEVIKYYQNWHTRNKQELQRSPSQWLQTLGKCLWPKQRREKTTNTSVFQTTAIKEWAISFNSSVIDDSASVFSCFQSFKHNLGNTHWTTRVHIFWNPTFSGNTRSLKRLSLF